MIHHVARATRRIIFWSTIAVAIGLTCLRIVLSGLAEYKTGFERTFFETTGIALKIGSLSAGMRGINPEVIFHHIDILSVNEAGRPAVRLKEARLGVELLPWLFSGDLIASSWLTLVGTQVAVIRHQDGGFSIQGLSADQRPLPLWLLRGGKYEILRSEISWQDDKRGQQAVSFKNVNMLVSNDNARHELRLLSDLPARYGDSLTLAASFTGNVLTGEPANGRLYVKGENIRLNEGLFGELVDGYDFTQGRASAEIWSNWQASAPVKIDALIQAEDLKITRTQTQKTFAAETLQTAFNWSRKPAGWELRVAELNLGAGRQHWPDGTFYVSAGVDGSFSALVPRLDLQAVNVIAPLLLDPEQAGRFPNGFDITGKLKNFAVSIADHGRRFAVRGLFDKLGFSAATPVFQFQGLSGYIDGNQRQGRLKLAVEPGQISDPELFSDALDFDRIAGTVNWHQDTGAWFLDSNSLAVANAELDSHSRFYLMIPHSDQSAYLDLQSRFEGKGDISQIARYLPVKIMQKTLVNWIGQAFKAGQIKRGGLLLSGNLEDFPFTGGQGKFEAQFDIDQGVLSYHPHWPLLTGLDAGVHFIGDRLDVYIQQAQSEQVKVIRAQVNVPTLSQAKSLKVTGLLRTRLDDGLRFMQKTPLHGQVDALLAATETDGDAQIDLDLDIPLVDNRPERVNGKIRLNNAALRVKSVGLPFDALAGEIKFTENAISSDDLKGRMLGFPLSANISTGKDAIQINMNGTARMQALQKRFSWLKNDFAHGRFSFAAQLELPTAQARNNPSRLLLYSDLQGVSVALPESLVKSADQLKPLQINLALTDDDRLPLKVNYADLLTLDLNIDKATRALRSGWIVYGQGPYPVPDQEFTGLNLLIRRPQLNVDEWLRFVDVDDESMQSRMPQTNHLDVRLDQLIWKGQQFGKVELSATKKGGVWQGNLSGVAAQGKFNVAALPNGNDKIHLDLSYLDLTALRSYHLPVSGFDRSRPPLIDIDSKRLIWQDADLGELHLKSERTSDGIRFNPVTLSGPDCLVNMTADWQQADGVEMTELRSHLGSDDFGHLLRRLGITKDLRETHADLKFSGNWQGAPYDLTAATLRGKLQVRLDEGRIASIEPGLGRLLGLISVEQWVKRLSLDFSDIYKKGLTFNHITGKFSISDGLAVTDDLLIDAIPARVKVTGSTDLVKETLQHNILVVPKSSGALPIAGTIVGGIASAVTQVIADDYKEGYFFGSEYRISGTWDNPDIIPLHDGDGILKKAWTDLTDFPWLKPDGK